MATAYSERDRHMFIARAVVSLLILVPSISIICLSATFSEAALKWAIGSCGLVLGYWLR